MAHSSPQTPSPQVELAPSAAIELFWVVINCTTDAPLLPLPAPLIRRVRSFWGDGERVLVEMLVVAQQCNCLTGWNIAPMFDLSNAKIQAPTQLTFETEPLEERKLLAARLKRLALEAKLRSRYGALLRDVWAHAGIALKKNGRPIVEQAINRMQAALLRKQSVFDLIPSKHLAHRPDFAALVRAALKANALLLTPTYFAGSCGHIVALPGLLSIGVGTDVKRDMTQRRTEAERVAAGLKLFSDPTRILILGELEREPTTVGEIARRVGIAQPTASVHLSLLRDAGLLEFQREGARTIYHVRRDRVQRTLDEARESITGAAVDT
jgi:DNA-binding transcriptional ArsR family regulator